MSIVVLACGMPPAIPTLDAQFEMLLSVLDPDSFENFKRLRDDPTAKIAHYTSAQLAMQIIRGEEVWLMPTASMNDSWELTYGLEHTREAFRSPEGQEFVTEMNRVIPGMMAEVATMMDSWTDVILQNSYIVSLSMHNESDNRRGRLSMLRQYGGDQPVALVLNKGPFVKFTDVLGANSAAVSYLEPEDFVRRLGAAAKSARNYAHLIESVDRELLKGTLFQMLSSSVLCVKHPGFVDEREWRVYHVAAMSEPGLTSIAKETIRGKERMVCKLPFREPPGEVLGVTVPALLDRVILGPMANRTDVRRQFIDLLMSKGVANATDRVVESDTPYRATS